MFLKGTFPVCQIDSIIILAIHRYFICGLVISKLQGKYLWASFVLVGQPKVDNGQRPEENQVSRTCSSCCQFFLPQVWQDFLGRLSDTIMSLSFPTSWFGLQ